MIWLGSYAVKRDFIVAIVEIWCVTIGFIDRLHSRPVWREVKSSHLWRSLRREVPVTRSYSDAPSTSINGHLPRQHQLCLTPLRYRVALRAHQIMQRQWCAEK
ncbi:hypothetical protein TRVL_02532 [Trypanosoma vivax]|nr:hypothetical protein TRVL_02532 [Trypanosoma vivax]